MAMWAFASNTDVIHPSMLQLEELESRITALRRQGDTANTAAEILVRKHEQLRADHEAELDQLHQHHHQQQQQQAGSHRSVTGSGEGGLELGPQHLQQVAVLDHHDAMIRLKEAEGSLCHKQVPIPCSLPAAVLYSARLPRAATCNAGIMLPVSACGAVRGIPSCLTLLVCPCAPGRLAGRGGDRLSRRAALRRGGRAHAAGAAAPGAAAEQPRVQGAGAGAAGPGLRGGGRGRCGVCGPG